MEYFKRSEEKNVVEIRFDKVFKQDIGFLNNFHLSKKRTYCNIADAIIDSNNRILKYDKNSELLFNYLVVKFRIDSMAYDTAEEFIESLYEILFRDGKLKGIITKHTNKNYKFNLDEKLIKNFNEGLQFTDHHCKILHMISVGMKYVIPLVLEYAFLNPTVQEDLGEFLLMSFDPLFDIFSPDVDILNKLYESVNSRITGTRYSDRVYWYYSEVMGYSIEYLTNNLIKKLIIDIIPKYDFEKNIISLNHVFINNNIEYTFRINFPINFKPLNLTEESGSTGLTDFDKLAINTARTNESEITINKVNIKTTIKHLMKKHKIKISRAEFDFYMKNPLNELQKNLLFLFFAKDFGSVTGLYNCNLKEYIILLIMMKRILAKNKFIYLQHILTGSVAKINEKKEPPRKNLENITSSEKYFTIVNEKFSYTAVNIQDSNIILKFITTIHRNNFHYYDFDNPETLGVPIKVNLDTIAEEIFRFIEMI